MRKPIEKINQKYQVGDIVYTNYKRQYSKVPFRIMAVNTGVSSQSGFTYKIEADTCDKCGHTPVLTSILDQDWLTTNPS